MAGTNAVIWLVDGTAWIGLILFAIGIILQSIAMWQLRSYYTVRLGVQSGQHLVYSREDPKGGEDAPGRVR